jgi:hypothetical protein
MIRKTRSASFLDAPPPRQATERELGDTRTSGNGREHRDRKAPKITVNSAPGKPLNIDMQPIDAVRLMSAFGTAEPGFATLMLRWHDQRSLRRGAIASPRIGGD